MTRRRSSKLCDRIILTLDSPYRFMEVSLEATETQYNVMKIMYHCKDSVVDDAPKPETGLYFPFSLHAKFSLAVSLRADIVYGP